MQGGLDALKKELRKNAEEEERKLLEEAEAEAGSILAEARAQAKSIVEQAEEEGKALATEEAGRVSAARLRARAVISEARERGIEGALALLLARLSKPPLAKTGASAKEYEKLFGKLVKAAMRELDGQSVVRCNKRDSVMARKLGKLGEPVACAGGVIVESQDGRIRVDASFEGLLQEHREELKKKAQDELYGKQK